MVAPRGRANALDLGDTTVWRDTARAWQLAPWPAPQEARDASVRLSRIPVWACCKSGSGILAALAANPAGNPGIRARRETVPRPPQLHKTAANPGKSGYLSRRCNARAREARLLDPQRHVRRRPGEREGRLHGVLAHAPVQPARPREVKPAPGAFRAREHASPFAMRCRPSIVSRNA